MKVLVAALVCLFLSPALAQDDLFSGSDSIVKKVENDPEANPADDLLTGDTLTLGGRYTFSAEANLTPHTDETFSVGLTELYTTLFLDARPRSDFRAFIEGDLSYATGAGVSLDLLELFADIDVYDMVFVRAGKQTINWGVGYFFSPANLVNLERIDPEDPDAELAGPVSVKAQVPVGTDNFTGYLILDGLTLDDLIPGDAETELAASVAARYEFLVGGYEVTTGGILENDGHWAVMATGSGSVEDVAVFAEAVLEGNSDKVFVVRDPSSPTGLSTATSASLFFSGTVGARYSYSTEDDRYTLSTSAQYYFNGLGYDDTGIFTDKPAAIGALIGADDLSVSDLQSRGQHYGAVSLSAPNLAKTEVTPSVFWLSNLSDGSGLASARVSYDGIDYLTPNLSYSLSYGAEGAEYSPSGIRESVSLSLSLVGPF